MKKIRGDLSNAVSTDAFKIIEFFKSLAYEQGFDETWINSVVSEAMSKDYDFMLKTLNMFIDDYEEPNFVSQNYIYSGSEESEVDENQLQLFSFVLH